MFSHPALAEAVYGGMDGIITTFAIISASVGGKLSPKVIIILGLSNVIADAYSMAVSRYEALITEKEQGFTKNKDPKRSAAYTFISFIICGTIPLIPFLLMIPKILTERQAAIISFILASILFFTIGYIKDDPNTNYRIPVTSGLQTLALGVSASIISYTIAHIIANHLIKNL